MKLVLGFIGILLFSVSGPVAAQTGYGPEFQQQYTIVEPQTVTCRTLDQNTGKIREERMELEFLEVIQTCESGNVAFITPSANPENVARAESVPLPTQEGDN